MNDTPDYVAITRLHAAYGDAVTRRSWEEMAELFEVGAPITIDTSRGDPVEVVGGAEMAAFVASAIERFRFFEFVPLNTVLTIDPAIGTATGQLYIQELRSGAADDRFSTAYGLYTDRYRRNDGRWQFAARHYRSLARTSTDDERHLEVLDPPT